MNYALETYGLGKRYRDRWALQDCTLQLPKGRVAGLVGLNGAGKTTLMHLAAGLLVPTTGSLRVCDRTPTPNDRSFLSAIGFVPQESALFPSFSVHEMLTLGRKLNTHWDQTLADNFLEISHISQKQRVGKLSGGQRSQLALLLALAKRPELLLLDEPFANVDPVARRECMKVLMETAAEDGMTIVISSHIITDLEPICDYLVVLSSSRVLLADETDRLLSLHKRLIIPGQDKVFIEKHAVLHRSDVGRQTSFLLRLTAPLQEHPSWQEVDISLEDIVLAYLEQQPALTNRTLSEKLEVK